jgi:hypothetical protein
MDIMLTVGCGRSILWRRSAVGGDLFVWNGDEDKGVRLDLDAFAFAALMVSLRDALLLAMEAVPSALALIDFAGDSS